MQQPDTASPGTPPPSAAPPGTDSPVVLDRRVGPYGEVVLRQHGELLQIIANGTFLMDTSDGRSERLLVRAALQELRGSQESREPGRGDAGGAPASSSAASASASRSPKPQMSRSGAASRWSSGRRRSSTGTREGGPLSPLSADAMRDDRTEIVHADLLAYLGDGADAQRFDALCLDIDNGPGWTVTDDNDSLYSPAGLAACAARLAPGGILAVWSAQPARHSRMRCVNAGFIRVRTQEIPVARGVPDVVHFATKPA